MTAMVFVPMSRRNAEALARGTDLIGPVVGYTATPALMQSYSYDSSMIEDGDFEAQTHAAVAALWVTSDSNLRLVLAVEAPAHSLQPGPGAAEDGAVLLEAIQRQQVQAVFVDEAEAGDAVAAARKALAADSDLTSALELPAVGALIADHDLLWHLPQEAW